jgi:predicted RNA-binding Zn ribbon-like protein
MAWDREGAVDAFEKPWPGAGIGGSLALDLVNTLDWRLREPPVEQLHEFADLLRWARSAGILESSEARFLRAWGESHPRAARHALSEAIEAREAIAAVFQAVARGQPVPSGPLSRLDAACRQAWAGRALRPAGPGAVWEWRGTVPERPAMAAALDAARLLTSPEREHVRECGDAQCGWLFVDSSRNRSRRWCNMQGCGNRNKARRFYRRQHNR